MAAYTVFFCLICHYGTWCQTRDDLSNCIASKLFYTQLVNIHGNSTKYNDICELHMELYGHNIMWFYITLRSFKFRLGF